MKISVSWLGEMVDLDGLSIDEIAERLTMTTALIEGVESTGGCMVDVRVGLVVGHQRHPDADRLSVCTVECGSGEPHTIVCGAPNVARDQKVAVILPGGKLPGGVEITARPLRGILSHGMICSEKELGLGQDAGGIMVLDPGAVVGQPLAEHLGLADQILEIDNKSITHRPDLWGHIGFARELGAIFGRPLQLPPAATALRAADGPVPVRIADPDLCPRYLALRFDGLAGAGTPLWMSRRLENCGVRSISLAVDLSNYVMLELGQPTHPFDFERLRGGRIVVRRAREGESLESIDHVERKLEPDMLVIADGERPVAIAGVMGGAESEVGEHTETILLESAAFDAVVIRKTSSRLGLRTDAVARFEKFLDPDWPEMALRRYAWLLEHECPSARIETSFTRVGSSESPPILIDLRPDRARRKLGVDIADAEMEQSLAALGFDVSRGGDRLQVSVPGWRGSRDVTLEDDLIEEVGRLHGYESVPACLPSVSCAPPVRDPLRDVENAMTNVLVTRCGMTEVLDYSMVEDRSLARVAEAGEGPYLRLRNPITADTSRLRRSLVPGMFRFIEANEKVARAFSLFQIGRAYLPESGNEEGLPEELRQMVALEIGSLQSARDPRVLRSLKGKMEVLFEALHRPLRYGTVEPPGPEHWFHPNRSASLVAGGCVIGTVGDLHPAVLAKLDVKRQVALAVVDIRSVLARPEEPRRFEPIPRFPAARFDLSLVAGWDVTIEKIVEAIRSVHREWIRDVELFDVFTGKSVPEGKRSLAFRLGLRSDERTLEDSEVMALRERIVDRLRELGLELR